MEAFEVAKVLVKAFEDKIGTDIMVLKVDEISTLADYFVIVTGNSTTQVRSLADEAEFQYNKLGLGSARLEGHGGDSWILLDCKEVIAHVFTKEAREYYNLEKLWADAPVMDLDNEEA